MYRNRLDFYDDDFTKKLTPDIQRIWKNKRNRHIGARAISKVYIKYNIIF